MSFGINDHGWGNTVSAAYERAANLYYQLQATSKWAWLRRYKLRVELNKVWEEVNS